MGPSSATSAPTSPPQLYAEIDNLCASLDISKRRFVEGALIAAVKEANAICAEVKPFELEG